MITALNNFDSVINKYQTVVLSTTCDSPADAISDCLNVNCSSILSFFLVAAFAYIGDSLFFLV